MSPLLPLDMRLWSTATVIPAALNKSWLEILGEFPKGEILERPTTQVNQESNVATTTKIEAIEVIPEVTPAPTAATEANEPNVEAENNQAAEESIISTAPIEVVTPISAPANESVINESTSTNTGIESENDNEATITTAPTLPAENPKTRAQCLPRRDRARHHLRRLSGLAVVADDGLIHLTTLPLNHLIT